MKICFLVELPTWESWDDGLRGAMKILEREHEICYHLNGLRGDHAPDLLMCWGGTLSKTYKEGLAYSGKKALFFAGGPRSKELFDPYDVVFFENQLHTDEVKQWNINCFTAFGTNTQIFYPMRQPKVFDTIYPAAFGLWKRKDLFAEAVKGLRALSLGNIQYHEMQCWDVCVENGVAVAADIPQSRLPYFMAMSKTVVVLPVPEIGCQRTVLEAMAMNIPVIVPNDAPLVMEFAEKGGGIIVDPDPDAIRQAILNAPEKNMKGYEYVQKEMTEKHYADCIRTGLLTL